MTLLKTFKKSSINRLLILAFTAIIILTGLFGVITVTQIISLSQKVDSILHTDIPAMELLLEADRDLYQVIVAERSMIFSDVSSEYYTKLTDAYKENLEQSSTRLADVSKLLNDKKEKELFTLYSANRVEWEKISDQIVKGRGEDSRGGRRLAMDLTTGSEPVAFDKMREHINELQEKKGEDVKKAGESISATFDNMLLILSTFLVFIIIGSIVTAMNISKIVKKRILSVTDETETIADQIIKGNLKSRANTKTETNDFTPFLIGVNKIIYAFIEPLTIAIDYFEKIANGVTVQIINKNYEGDFNNFKNNVNKLVNITETLQTSISGIINAAEAGDLQKRVDASIFNGQWNNIVKGLNQTLDTISKPVTECISVMKKVADDNLTARINTKYNGDFMTLSNSINTAVETLSKVIDDNLNIANSVENASDILTSDLKELSASNEKVSNQTKIVAKTTAEITMNINNVASSIEEMSMTSANVSDSTHEMAETINSVSKSIQQLTSSASNISSTVKGALETSLTAEKYSIEAKATIGNLDNSAKEIGKIVGIIKRISEQTNLLALNATIEAASAGEAGKGFAVVANEIKELATQSSNAAEDIASKVGTIQSDMVNSIENITKVAEIIDKISSEVNIVSKAVDEQLTTSQEISVSVTETSQRTSSVSKNISEMSLAINEVADNTSKIAIGSQDVSDNMNMINEFSQKNVAGLINATSSSTDLNNISEKLKQSIERFKIE